MSKTMQNIIVVCVFALIAFLGIALSLSAPYVANNDELVYLTGQAQVLDKNLPDSYMLQGMDFGPYLYPKILFKYVEDLGFNVFKSIYLTLLILSIGISAFIAYRLMLLPWIPALFLSIVSIMPRFSSGMEIFGVFTFKEAIGRANAMPLFFITTGFLIKRMRENKSLWPIFGLCGAFIFLHPVNVILFTFVSLISVAAIFLYRKTPILDVTRRIIMNGLVFLAAGSYFFVDVFSRLLKGVETKSVDAKEFVDAIVLKNAWEFLPESAMWFPHMFIVSLLFIFVLILFYKSPRLNELRKRYALRGAKEVLLWGITMVVSSLVITILLPNINLFLMNKFDAPYIFQQWSRVSKFYYLGVFIAFVPISYTLWGLYKDSTHKLKNLILGAVVLLGVLSSSFGFEVAQFVFRYENYTESYIPQKFSGIPDDTTFEEYYETCDALETLGATSSDAVLSNNFALRYFCRSDLYVTFEEGSAYQQLYRSDVVDWHKRVKSQREALSGGELEKAISFAKEIGANFIVVPNTEKYVEFRSSEQVDKIITSKNTVLRLNI